LATGFAERMPRFTSQLQRLESVDCRERMVLRARSSLAISSIHAWIVSGFRLLTTGQATV
jgi:hypothetical protein